MLNNPILQLKNIYHSYSRKPILRGKYLSDNKTYSLHDISLNLHKGEILGLIGESGSGKTTLGKSIIKLNSIDQGEIVLFENNITKMKESKFRLHRQKIQMIFQDLDAALNPNMTVKQILWELIVRYHNKTTNKNIVTLENLLTNVGLDKSFLFRYPHELSGGQKRRVAIASALTVEPDIIIADEPTTGLDSYTQAIIIALICDLQKNNNLSMIMISHDLQLIKTVCQRIAVLYRGHLVELASVDQIVQFQFHPYTQLLWESHITHESKVFRKPLLEINRKRYTIQSGLTDYENARQGCLFSPRCTRFREMGKPTICRSEESKPQLVEIEPGHKVACHFPLSDSLEKFK